MGNEIILTQVETAEPDLLVVEVVAIRQELDQEDQEIILLQVPLKDNPAEQDTTQEPVDQAVELVEQAQVLGQ